MEKCYRVLDRRGRFTIPSEIRHSGNFRCNDILSLELLDPDTIYYGGI